MTGLETVQAQASVKLDEYLLTLEGKLQPEVFDELRRLRWDAQCAVWDLLDAYDARLDQLEGDE